tara:strand:- start:6903 stop:7241 length:339 start_codon:yes stop_codon:yes gene_type:complete
MQINGMIHDAVLASGICTKMESRAKFSPSSLFSLILKVISCPAEKSSLIKKSSSPLSAVAVFRLKVFPPENSKIASSEDSSIYLRFKDLKVPEVLKEKIIFSMPLILSILCV